MNKKIEIIKDLFVGDTVILKEETELTKKQNLTIGTIGIVSNEDNDETLKGWEKVNLEEVFKEEIDKMSPEKIKELFDELVKIGKIKNSDKIDEIIQKNK
jgi:hypothetical protein